MSTAERVVFEHVTKRYPGTGAGNPGAVEDLSLEVPAGKICVLVGPSGCGKTTSLKMVNRLIEPTSGRILIGDTDVMSRDVIALRRGIGYVIQQVGLFPHQTVGENVATVPRLLGWDSGRRRARAEELLQLVGLDPARYAARYPAALSGGERQRVGVARALAADPPVLLMDEPFGAVDPIVRERLQNELLNLQEQLAKTILFVTHDIDEAIKMGDLVAVMQTGGRLAQFGTPDEVLTNPASDFVARFVGADRGLKRLALRRVAELELTEAVTARPGDDASGPRSRALESDVPYILILDTNDRPIGWVAAATSPASGPLDPELATAMSPLLDRHTTLKDALSMLLASDVQAGIVIDGQGAYRGLVTAESITERMRAARGIGRVIRWDVITGNLPLISQKFVEHVLLTVTAVGIGLVLSFLAVLAIRRWRVLTGPITGIAGAIYTIPSLALLVFLIPITRLTATTAEIALVGYTLLILIRNLLAGLDSVPRDALDAADAMGYGATRRLWQVELPLALPVIAAGVRIAVVTTIGLVMVTALIGLGGLGQVMLRGYNFRNETLTLVGFVLTVALGVAADLSLGWLTRRITPWAAARG